MIFPSFVDEGLTKLTNSAASLVEGDESMIGNELYEFEQKLHGPFLSSSKRKWLEKHLKLSEDTMGSEDVRAGTLFRKTQKKTNFSFMI